jgi:glycerol-3-phosphate dehydrogenase
MNRHLPALADQRFDLLIIGGGIFGAGIARDAALRGLRVALIDKSDFASGTTSASSKLIHGGFRYLAHRQFGFVSESCRERRILQRIAPHLVRPLPFLFPVYDSGPHSLLTMRLGMTVYDALALFRNTARHQALSPKQTLLNEPAISARGLRGAIRFYDCQEDDARFCVDNILHAAASGAVCANYCELVGFVTREHRIVAARVADRLSHNTFEIAARAYVNAAGPWVQSIADLTPFDGDRLAPSPTKGVHLLLPRLTRQTGVFFHARRDGRILFVIPWGEYSLVGTTDTDFCGRPEEAYATPADIDYLFSELRSLMPEANIRESDIITTFAGVRPLLHSALPNPSDRSREHRIVRQGQNLLSVAGGKYTTYRIIAAEAVDRVYSILGARPAPCRTAETPLPGHRPQPSGTQIADAPVVYTSDVAHACKCEMAMTVSDVMRRRTALALSRYGGPDTAETVAKFMAPLMGWNGGQMLWHLQQYLDEWKRNLP